MNYSELIELHKPHATFSTSCQTCTESYPCTIKRTIDLTENAVRESIEKILKRRASQCAYFKEEFQNKNYMQDAELQETFEAIWNEAADIALGIRKE